MSLEELIEWHLEELEIRKLSLLGWQESGYPEPEKGRHVQVFEELIQFHKDAVELLRKRL